MTAMRLAALAALLSIGALAACGGATMISPNDPQYARTGAPRAGEPMISPENSYGRIMGPDSSGPR